MDPGRDQRRRGALRLGHGDLGPRQGDLHGAALRAGASGAHTGPRGGLPEPRRAAARVQRPQHLALLPGNGDLARDRRLDRAHVLGDDDVVVVAAIAVVVIVGLCVGRAVRVVVDRGLRRGKGGVGLG